MVGLRPAAAGALRLPSCLDSAPTAGAAGRAPARLIGPPPVQIDLAQGRFCAADCPDADDASGGEPSETGQNVVLTADFQTAADGGLLYTRLDYNPRLRIYALYQTVTKAHQPTRDLVTLIDCKAPRAP